MFVLFMFGFLDLKDMLKILNGQSRFSFLTLIITPSKLQKKANIIWVRFTLFKANSPLNYGG